MPKLSFVTGESIYRTCFYCSGKGAMAWPADVYDIIEWLEDNDQLVTAQRLEAKFGAPSDVPRQHKSPDTKEGA